MDSHRSVQSTNSPSTIESWLESLPGLTAHFLDPNRSAQQPSRKRAMSGSRTSSPAKRPRLDNMTATSTPSHPLSAPPSLPTGSSATRRSASPTKKVSDLTFFRKPIHYVPLPDNTPLQQLPDDVHHLYRAVSAIQYLESVIPHKVRPDLERILGSDHVRDSWFQAPTAGLTPEQETLAAEALAPVGQGHRRRTRRPTTRDEFAVAELDTLLAINAEAKELSCSSEAAWNTLVHWPLLKHALSGFRHLRIEMATTAQIAKPAMPPTQKSHHNRDLVSQGKMVDMAITLRLPYRPWDPTVPPADTQLMEAIRSAAVSGELADGLESVNQTMYEPVRYTPIAVSIETKTSAGDDEAAKVQLGVWVAAWHHRLEAFRRAEGIRIVTLPLLLVTGHHWQLLFACDRGWGIEIVHEISIGDTQTLLAMYRLVAVLRALGRWVESSYRQWVEEWFLHHDLDAG